MLKASHRLSFILANFMCALFCANGDRKESILRVDTHPEMEVGICRALFENPHNAAPVIEILKKISSAVAGGESEPSYENVEKFITINNAIVMDALGRLKAIDDPKDSKFLWTVSRLVSFWFRNRALHNYYWLAFIKGNDGSELSAPAALKHLMGSSGSDLDSGGVIGSALSLIAEGDVPVDSSTNGTNIFRLSEAFLGAVTIFHDKHAEVKDLEQEKRYFLGMTLVGRSRGPILFFEILDKALCASFLKIIRAGQGLVASSK